MRTSPPPSPTDPSYTHYLPDLSLIKGTQEYRDICPTTNFWNVPDVTQVLFVCLFFPLTNEIFNTSANS